MVSVPSGQIPLAQVPSAQVGSAQVPLAQIPGVYHRRIGDIVVTALSDGYLDGTVDVLQNITSTQ
jgi:hypothetical protein